MIIDSLNTYLFNFETFHSFTRFLGTPTGELLRRSIELIFYLIIIYMIISEFRKNRKREYKYLIVGFLALSFRQMFMVPILFNNVFSAAKFTRFDVFISFVDNYFEIIALLLLVSAFMFPAFKTITLVFQKNILRFFYYISLITFLTYFLFRMLIIQQMYAIIVLNLIKIGILIAPFFLVTNKQFTKIRHNKAILLAFFIYLLIPLSSVINILLAGRVTPRVSVIQHPLPFIAILLLMRTVYLTLVDKAFLNTKLRESEARIRHERELHKLKDHFISFVSHELRTPITSIKLFLSLFKSGKFGKINKEQGNAISTLINENNRLSDLITNLLTISRIEAKKLNLEKTDFQLHEIIDGLYINIARNSGILVVNKVPKRFWVNADKNMIKQVYINLINNAIKFSKKGGKIELKAGRNKKEWFLSVKDHGIGISKSELPKLFDKFYQADTKHTRMYQGIGLGLAIVRNIVELHGGRIDVNSTLGKGTEFTIWISQQQKV